MSAEEAGMADDERIRGEILQEVHDIIRSVSISRGAVLTSTPEQIVHMTARAIEENLTAYANREPSNYRWFPQIHGVVADIRREIEDSRLSAKSKEIALRAIARGADGWPA